MTASEIMTTQVACCTMDQTLRDTAQMMVRCDCGCLPVVQDREGRRLVGLITDRDIVCRAVADGLDPNTTLAGECMSSGVVPVRPETSVKECVRIMEVHQIRRLPVVNEQGSVIGIVSQADIALSAPARETGELVEGVSRPYLA